VSSSDFQLPPKSPAAPLAQALVQLGDAVCDPENEALLPPGMAEQFFLSIVAAVHLLHVREIASAGAAEDAIEDAAQSRPDAEA
jgi:hypothetical protein